MRERDGEVRLTSGYFAGGHVRCPELQDLFVESGGGAEVCVLPAAILTQLLQQVLQLLGLLHTAPRPVSVTSQEVMHVKD